MDYDFSNLILLSDERKMFKRFHGSKVVSASKDDVLPLIIHCLVQSENLKTTGKYVLSDKGKRYKEYVRLNRRERITTRAIAITALVLAGLSIVAQVWTSLMRVPQ